MFRWVTVGVYVLSCRLASGPLWLGIYPFLWCFSWLFLCYFLLHWRYEFPCQDKLPEFHCTPILGCIRVLWLVFHPLGLRLDKALCCWNSVRRGPERDGHRTMGWEPCCIPKLIVCLVCRLQTGQTAPQWVAPPALPGSPLW